MGSNATLIAAQMFLQDHITEDEEDDIQREDKIYDKAAKLIMCVLRKNCVASFINSIKMLEISALDSLAAKIEEHMDICGELKFPYRLNCVLHL